MSSGVECDMVQGLGWNMTWYKICVKFYVERSVWNVMWYEVCAECDVVSSVMW